MGYIYKISNSANDKVYIGQTKRTIEKRFQQHKRDIKKYKDRPIKLYQAMQKYGADNFFVEEVEKCDDSALNEREIYWISYFDSYHNGYNTTMGGGGQLRDDRDAVMALWNKGLLVTEIKQETGFSQEHVIYTLLNCNVELDDMRKRANESRAKKVKVPVYQYDLDGNFVKEYASIWDAEKETGIHHGCISGVLCNAHYSAGFYQWRKYKVDNIGKCQHKFCATSKTVYKYTEDGDYICSYQSITQAANAVGLKSILPIRRVCNGTAHTSKGYRWSYDLVDKLPPMQNALNDMRR